MSLGAAIIDDIRTSDDGGRAFQLQYNTPTTGWWGWIYNSTTPWAMSNNLATEGGGNIWFPNGTYHGAADWKTKISYADVAPTSGAHLAGEVVYDRRTLDNVWAFVCVADGTPGTWVTIYLPNVGSTTLTTAGTTITVNWATSNTQVIDLQGASGNVTLTINNPQAGQLYRLKIIQGSVARNLIWPAEVKWPAGVAPTITVTNDAIDLVELFYDGAVYLSKATQAFA